VVLDALVSEINFRRCWSVSDNYNSEIQSD
jgi:hypothetical protein